MDFAELLHFFEGLALTLHIRDPVMPVRCNLDIPAIRVRKCFDSATRIASTDSKVDRADYGMGVPNHVI